VLPILAELSVLIGRFEGPRSNILDLERGTSDDLLLVRTSA